MKDLKSYFTEPGSSPLEPSEAYRQFDQFEATTLFCSRCRQAVPVRKKLLLVLPDGEKYDYLCPYCGSSVGTKVEKREIPDQVIVT
ncbi:MAG: cytoplasmic protein [Deltaproteobacteria bacterium]|nr:cytoplasmic protein [Deltaproteobacteria bacterium]